MIKEKKYTIKYQHESGVVEIKDAVFVGIVFNTQKFSEGGKGMILILPKYFKSLEATEC